jgi:hypothetical protein
MLAGCFPHVWDLFRFVCYFWLGFVGFCYGFTEICLGVGPFLGFVWDSFRFLCDFVRSLLISNCLGLLGADPF